MKAPHNGGQIVTDSALLKGGSFQFTGTLREPVPARLIINHKGAGFGKTTSASDIEMIYLEPRVIQILSKDSLKLLLNYTSSPYEKTFDSLEQKVLSSCR